MCANLPLESGNSAHRGGHDPFWAFCLGTRSRFKRPNWVMSPQNANLAQKGIVSPADLVKLARMPPAPLRKEGDCSCDLSKAEPRRGFRGAHRYAASAAVRGAAGAGRALGV